MLSFALLEWRKNGRFLWGMAALFVLSLPLAAVSSVRAKVGAVPGVEAGLLFWVGLGVPFAALFLGAASGAGQRGDLARQAEALLPLSPARRAVGALLSSVAQTLALAALVAAAASFSPTVRHAFAEGELWGMGSPFLRPIIAVSLFSALYGLLAAFCLSYALGHGILGGAAAVLLTLPIAGGLCWARGLELMFGPRVPFGFESWLIVAAAAAGPLLALPVLARWLDRRAWPGWRGVARVVGALALGLVVAFLALAHQGDRLLRGVFLTDAGGFQAEFLQRAMFSSRASYSSMGAGQALAAWPRARGAAAAGTAAHDIRGRVVWLTPDGRRSELVPPLPIERVGDLERLGPWIGTRSLAFGRDGSFHLVLERWGLSDAKPRWELWMGKEPPLKRVAGGEGGAMGLLPMGHDLYLFDRRGSQAKVQRIGADGSLGPARPLDKEWFAPWRAAGLAARVDGTRLVGPNRTWTLPGTPARMPLPEGTRLSGLPKKWEKLALEDAPGVWAVWLGGRIVYPARVTLPDGEGAYALCGDDGVRVVLKRRRPEGFGRLEPVADGSFWSRNRRDEPWDILTADGTALPPFDPRPAEAAVGAKSDELVSWGTVLLHAEGQDVWLLARGRALVKARASDGKPEWVKKLPYNAPLDAYGTAPYAASAEGLFWHTGRRILFFGWDGKKRDLGPVVGR